MTRLSLLAAAGACLLALALAGSAVPWTTSSFTASVTNAGNSFAAAAVNTAPDVTAAAIGKSSGGAVGSVRRSGTFYVYANATDDRGVSMLRATLTNLTGSSTAVTLSAGSWRAGGVSYGWRSAALTASSSLSNGAKSFTVTATDAAGLTDTFTGSVTADSTSPSARSIATTNKAGGIAGRAEQGDTAVVAFTEAIDSDSLVDGWDGTALDVQVAIVDGGGSSNDLLRVYDEDTLDPDGYLPIGTIDLRRSDFVMSGSPAVFGLATASGTASRIVLSGATLTITLGSLDLGSSNTSSGNAVERYTPVSTITDVAGNASGTSTVSASGSHRAF
ncbi:MAG TPA: hypothetical protein VK506_02420 [Conexibacter sp.]|nr:hypothetical protein [Conexibacter sp.]